MCWYSAQRPCCGCDLFFAARSAVVYQHFDSKPKLYLALLDERGQRLLTRISKATAGATSGKDQTELGFQAYSRWVADDHDAFLLLFGSGARRDEEFNDAVRKVTAEVAEAIKPLIATDIDPNISAPLPAALSAFPRE